MGSGVTVAEASGAATPSSRHLVNNLLAKFPTGIVYAGSRSTWSGADPPNDRQRRRQPRYCRGWIHDRAECGGQFPVQLNAWFGENSSR
ncbi:hypothetical protein CPI83_29140 (plasmid) [Rhodococcus sp. H-CA8f]|nr:hypothetical protein CPI83_29140 [Rhodococcus sp. H-CA8f]